jgi:hypothetical protein
MPNSAKSSRDPSTSSAQPNHHCGVCNKGFERRDLRDRHKVCGYYGVCEFTYLSQLNLVSRNVAFNHFRSQGDPKEDPAIHALLPSLGVIWAIQLVPVVPIEMSPVNILHTSTISMLKTTAPYKSRMMSHRQDSTAWASRSVDRIPLTWLLIQN